MQVIEPSADILPLLHPGVLLKREFLDDMGITGYRLAKETGLSQGHVAEMLKGERNITAVTSLRLGRYFGQSPRFWLNIQTRYDIWLAERQAGEEIERIRPYVAA